MRRSPARQKTVNDSDTEPNSNNVAILFDLDGTLLDSNNEHVLAWRLALRREGIEIRNAILHRCIGMRGALLMKAAFREIGRTAEEGTKKRLEKWHKKYFEKTLPVRSVEFASAICAIICRQ